MHRALTSALTALLLSAPALAGTYSVNFSGPALDPALTVEGNGSVSVSGGSAQVAFPTGSGAVALVFPAITGDFVASVEVTRPASFSGSAGIVAGYLIRSDGTYDLAGFYRDTDRVVLEAGGPFRSFSDSSSIGTFVMTRTGININFAFNGTAIGGVFSDDPITPLNLYVITGSGTTPFATVAGTSQFAAATAPPPAISFSNFIISGPNVSNSTSNDTTPVPEPASLALLSVGIVGLASVRRRRT